MTRHIVLGNGELLVNIDKWLQVRDIYFPYPGQENHLLGHANRIGVFVDGQVSWINEDAWQRSLAYKPNTAISDCTANNDELQTSLQLNDAVHCSKNVFVRKLTITNTSDRDREYTLFFHHDFHLYGDGVGDTAGYDPVRNALFHYKRQRYFLMSPLMYDAKNKLVGDLYEYSIGEADSNETFFDAQDGRLNKVPMSQGSVDSICSVRFSVPAGQKKEVHYVMCVGKNFREVFELYDELIEATPKNFRLETDMCWKGLANRIQLNFHDLSEESQRIYKRSLLLINTQMAKNGAITAANDSDNRQFNKDTYSYVWPRDGALVAMSLQRAGFPDLAQRFYDFCASVATRSGFFLHKYNPDGSLGSSWHPWVDEKGEAQLAIQEDETALIVIALWDYCQRTGKKDECKSYYDKIVKPAADFMMLYMHDDIDLPKESYDLWEERRGILTFTCGTVVGALEAASKFAKLYGDKDAKKYLDMSQRIKKAMGEHLYSKEKQCFARMLTKEGHQFDETIESSVALGLGFASFDIEDERVIKTMQKIEEALWLRTEVGGLARYPNDIYHQVSADVPGNPWFICTLWLAKWYIMKAKEKKELSRAKELIEWCTSHALPTGVLPEQLNPHTGEPLSVAPLTWSHAEFVDTCVLYSEKMSELKV